MNLQQYVSSFVLHQNTENYWQQLKKLTKENWLQNIKKKKKRQMNVKKKTNFFLFIDKLYSFSAEKDLFLFLFGKPLKIF